MFKSTPNTVMSSAITKATVKKSATFQEKGVVYHSNTVVPVSYTQILPFFPATKERAPYFEELITTYL